MNKNFYVNLYSGCWLTDGELKHLLSGQTYELVPETSDIEGFRVVFEEVK